MKLNSENANEPLLSSPQNFFNLAQAEHSLVRGMLRALQRCIQGFIHLIQTSDPSCIFWKAFQTLRPPHSQRTWHLTEIVIHRSAACSHF